MLDQFYISFFNYCKKNYGKRSFNLALIYINILEISLLLALAKFFMAFAKQMKITQMSSSKFWVFFIIVVVVVVFKNWMRYNGKKRTILNAKLKGKSISISLLVLFPIAALLIAYILMQVK